MLFPVTLNVTEQPCFNSRTTSSISISLSMLSISF
jgi:hypothetical protein